MTDPQWSFGHVDDGSQGWFKTLDEFMDQSVSFVVLNHGHLIFICCIGMM